MSVVEVKVGARNFSLACEDGQEESLKNLAAKIDEKVETLSKQMRTQNDSLLLLMTALMTQDELDEIKGASGGETVDVSKIISEKDEEVAELVNTVSNYVETMIDKIEKQKAA